MPTSSPTQSLTSPTSIPSTTPTQKPIQIATFTANSTWTPELGVLSYDVLLVGGGGAGGRTAGGGGGGGQVIVMSNLPALSGANYTIIIGQGGKGATIKGEDGEATTFHISSPVGQTLSAAGGKGGAAGIGGTGGASGSGTAGGSVRAASGKRRPIRSFFDLASVFLFSGWLHPV